MQTYSKLCLHIIIQIKMTKVHEQDGRRYHNFITH
jgi:hypothetical protein